MAIFIPNEQFQSVGSCIYVIEVNNLDRNQRWYYVDETKQMVIARVSKHFDFSKSKKENHVTRRIMYLVTGRFVEDETAGVTPWDYSYEELGQGRQYLSRCEVKVRYYDLPLDHLHEGKNLKNLVLCSICKNQLAIYEQELSLPTKTKLPEIYQQVKKDFNFK